MIRRAPLVAVSFAAALVTVLPPAALSPTARADAVHLKTSVRLPPGADVVHLRDVAELEGADAERFADLVVAPVERPDTTNEIPLQVIREALDAAGVHWGRVNLAGNRVVVRCSGRARAEAPRPMTGASLLEASGKAGAGGDAPAEATLASTLIDRPSLRGTIARRFVKDLDLAPDRIRLMFDTSDRERLDGFEQRVTWELRLEDNARSDRVTITVRGWTDGRVVDSAHVTVRPQLLVSTAVLARDVKRDEALTRTDVTSEDAWLPPSQVPLCARIQDVEGRFAQRSMRSGTSLRTRQLRSPTLVDRGDRVVVRCMVGGIVLSLQAEARADGAAGDTIEFRKLGERNTFLATVTERGEAVFDLGL